jgi:hypothetical protein
MGMVPAMYKTKQNKNKKQKKNTKKQQEKKHKQTNKKTNKQKQQQQRSVCIRPDKNLKKGSLEQSYR